MKEIVIPVYIKVKMGKTRMEGKQFIATLSAKSTIAFLPLVYCMIGAKFLFEAMKALMAGPGLATPVSHSIPIRKTGKFTKKS